MFAKYPKKRFGDFCTTHARIGWQKLTKAEFLDEGDYYLVTGWDIMPDHTVAFEQCKYVTKERYEQDSKLILGKGDVLLTKDGTLGKVAIIGDLDKPATLNGHIFVIRPKDERIIPEFLLGLFISDDFINQLDSNKTGSTIKGITQKALLEFEIPIAPVGVQQQYVDFMKQSDKSKFVMFKSQFIEMFGDPVTNSLGRKQVPFADFMTDIKYGTSQPPQFSEDGVYKFIRATNIKKGRITEESMLRIDEVEASKIQKCKLNGNEIIIVRSGANTGDTCVVTSEYAGNYAGYDIIITLDAEKANPVYFNELINTHYMEQIVKPLTVRSAQPHLNAKQVQEMPMIVASLEEQNVFAALVEQSDKSK